MKDASEHHGALRRMRLCYEGLWTLDATGARFHRYERRREWGRRSAPAKIASHLLAAGYAETGVEERRDNMGSVHRRVRRYERGADVVRVVLDLSDRTGSEVETVSVLEHYPDGTQGSRPRLSASDVIWAMSWGMSGPRPACLA